ncbi:MAG: CotH kinase family protein, partial [Bacteroidales bacterium]|nr:CotH kinase family protein [Bacteroidales bacterium]
MKADNLKRIITLCFFLIFFQDMEHPVAQTLSIVSVTESLEFTSSDLPIVVINTHGQDIVDEIRIVADMGIIDNGKGQRNYITDPFNDYNGRIAIELRGSATLYYPKKQYRFETQDSLGNNLNVSLLGLPPENDWIFYGPYDDQSLIRNVLAYKLSNDIGRYASRTRFFELVLNGDYRGLYVLMEKIKRDKNRVDILRMDPSDTTGDTLTGGYIIKIDKVSGENVGIWQSSMGTLYQYHYPKADVIVREQRDYIKNFMDEFEWVMGGADYADPVNGYFKYIDLDSFVDHFIINEVCKNVDAYRISAFLYKDRDSNAGKLVAGPIWDFNLSFGKAWFQEDLFLIAGWQVDYNSHRPWDSFKVPFWWEKLSRDSTFVDRLQTRWNELKNGILQKENMHHIIDSLIGSLSEARLRNFERWPESAGDHSYTDEIYMMKQWIDLRMAWIDANLGYLLPKNVLIPEKNLLRQNYPN